MQRFISRQFVVQALVAAAVCLVALAASGTLPSAPAAGVAYAQAGAADAALLAEGEAKQVIQFNPNASLQKRIFADGFVPNSSEFSLDVGGTPYTAQRAENLKNGQVRIYYVVTGQWSNVRQVIRGSEGGNATYVALLQEGEKRQVIQFNPGAALQKRIFADGFVPNSSEFSLETGGASYTAQRAESLKTGQVRVYYVANADWAHVGHVIRGGGGSQPAPAADGTPTIAETADAVTATEDDMRVTISKDLPMPPPQLTGDVSRRVDEATVQLVVLTKETLGVGTGTVVGPDGRTVLTAFHVIGDLDTKKVYDPLLIAVGPFMDYDLEAKVVATDAENDLAVLRIEPHEGFGGFNHLEIVNSDASTLREPAYVYSYPARREGGLARSTGTLLVIASNVKSGQRRVFMTDGEAAPGSSGGVIVNGQGQVMGIIVAGMRLPRGIDRPGIPTLTQLTAFMPINLAKPILAQAGVR